MQPTTITTTTIGTMTAVAVVEEEGGTVATSGMCREGEKGLNRYR
jgi:hypothetical protein